MQNKAHTKEFHSKIDPRGAYEFLKEGNQRFADKHLYNEDLSQQVEETKSTQYPFAAVVSCMDSRTSVELTFGRGIGEIFSIRIAGNIVNDDIIGSLEFAVAAKEVKLIAVLGHTTCGAIAGASSPDATNLPYLDRLLEKIKPAVEKARETAGSKEPSGDEVAKANVEMGIDEILEKSEVIRKAFDESKIGIVGGIYNTANGRVDFFKERFKN